MGKRLIVILCAVMFIAGCASQPKLPVSSAEFAAANNAVQAEYGKTYNFDGSLYQLVGAYKSPQIPIIDADPEHNTLLYKNVIRIIFEHEDQEDTKLERLYANNTDACYAVDTKNQKLTGKTFVQNYGDTAKVLIFACDLEDLQFSDIKYFFLSGTLANQTEPQILQIPMWDTTQHQIPDPIYSSDYTADEDDVDETITYAEYEKIKEGMSYAVVKAFIGCDGDLISSVDIAGYKTKLYVWYGSGGIASATVIFENNKVVSKSQFGLD